MRYLRFAEDLKMLRFYLLLVEGRWIFNVTNCNRKKIRRPKTIDFDTEWKPSLTNCQLKISTAAQVPICFETVPGPLSIHAIG